MEEQSSPCKRAPGRSCGLPGLFGFLFILGALLGFWSPLIDAMASSVPPVKEAPDYIVILPAGGVPGGTTLARLWEGAALARKWPKAKVVLSLATKGDPWENPIGRMAEELLLRGVPKEAILFETTAKNTFGHATGIVAAKIGDPATDRYALVTSRFHLYRSWRVFEAVGFAHVAGAAVDEGETVDTLGEGTALRYAFWGELIDGIILIREGVALAWYHLNGNL